MYHAKFVNIFVTGIIKISLGKFQSLIKLKYFAQLSCYFQFS